ncbi:P-loop containing nucleoside triphosphate hydrolase protein [Paraphysoderma sedebokerense]|nr:P-loop containing nucleoside triphosphate hydrolase protein [Paraphysoderma sedebokerense]
MPDQELTNTLVARIFRLLSSGKRPHQIIAITFSNEAQRSLLNRIEETLRRYGDGSMSLYFPFVKTIDAFAAMICDCYFAKPTIILDDVDFISRVYDELKSHPVYGHCHTLEGIVKNYYTKLKLPADNNFLQTLEGINEEHMNLGIATHRTRLMWVIKFLEKNQQVLRHYQKEYHILVDEFQDVDSLQNTFIKLIAPPSPTQKIHLASTVTVVGDDDQAIYAFRGGSIEPIQKFAQIYEKSNPKIVSLIENYRSIQSIIDFNCRFISNLETRAKAGVEFLSKASLPDVSNHAQGESNLQYGVHICSSANFTTALDHTLNHMEDLILTRKIDPSKFAVLVYSNAECDDITYGCRLRRLEIAEEDISDGIFVSTFHKAKGLEREIVFVLWCYPYSWDPDKMRLFYVACTRAKCLLHINLYSRNGYADNKIFEEIDVQVKIDTECQLAVNLPSNATEVGEKDSTELLDDIDETLLKFLVPEKHESSPPEDVESSVHDNYTVNVSSLASFFLFQCGRRLYRQMKWAPPNCVQKVTTESSVSKMLKDAGLKWEERIVDWLKHKKLLGYDRWKGDNVSILLRSIADSHRDQYLYEPSIPVSSEICRAIGLPVQITVRTIRPDFIKIKTSPAGIRSLQVIDAKFSSQPKVHQKIQVALYCLILQEMIRRLGFSNQLSVDPIGGIWLPPDKDITTHSLQDSDLENFISYFDTIYLKAPIKTYLKKHISHVLVEKDDDYHLSRVCSSCEHSDTCLKDATAGRKHLSLLPVINRAKRKELLASGICDIEDIIQKSLPAAVTKSYPGIITMVQNL